MISTVYVAIGTIAAATIAGAISFISTVLSKEQKTSEFRQAWIDGVRDDISELIAGVNVITAFLAAKHIQDPMANKLELLLSQAETLNDISTRYYRLQLRLNPKEHKALIKALMDVYSAVSLPDTASDRDKVGRLNSEVIALAQTSLKVEWKRVKRGEPAFYITKSISLGVVIFAVLSVLFVTYS